jgi:hypothetical protein
MEDRSKLPSLVAEYLATDSVSAKKTLKKQIEKIVVEFLKEEYEVWRLNSDNHDLRRFCYGPTLARSSFDVIDISENAIEVFWEESWPHGGYDSDTKDIKILEIVEYTPEKAIEKFKLDKQNRLRNRIQYLRDEIIKHQQEIEEKQKELLTFATETATIAPQ